MHSEVGGKEEGQQIDHEGLANSAIDNGMRYIAAYLAAINDIVRMTSSSVRFQQVARIKGTRDKAVEYLNY